MTVGLKDDLSSDKTQNIAEYLKLKMIFETEKIYQLMKHVVEQSI